MSKEYLIAVDMSDHYTETTVDNCYILNKGISSPLTV